MKEEKIRVLALLPTEYAKIVTIDNTLEAMQPICRWPDRVPAHG